MSEQLNAIRILSYILRHKSVYESLQPCMHVEHCSIVYVPLYSAEAHSFGSKHLTPSVHHFLHWLLFLRHCLLWCLHVLPHPGHAACSQGIHGGILCALYISCKITIFNSYTTLHLFALVFKQLENVWKCTFLLHVCTYHIYIASKLVDNININTSV